MYEPVVSIVIPVYNAEKHLCESLDSIINQTYKNLQIICVDDGSTDSSLQILQNYQNQDARVKVLTQKNQYAGVARNNGMAHATGEYIMFLDSDDLFEKNMVDYLVRKANRFDPDIIVFGYWRFIDGVKSRRPVKNHYKNGIVCSSKDIKDNIFQMTRSMPWDKFIKTDFLKRTGIEYQNTKVNNDIFFNRIIVTQAEKILFCTKRFVNYRVSNSESLQGKLNKNPVDFLSGNEKIYQELVLRDSYSTFKISFEEMIITDVLLHLKSIDSYDSFVSIAEEVKKRDFFEKLNIIESSELIEKHNYSQTLHALFAGDLNECLANLYCETCSECVNKSSIEYRIGHSILKALRLTY